MSKQYKYLFSPLKLGNQILKNRIVFSAHLTNLAENNLPSEKHAYYYAERAKGGAGLIITEELSVHPTDHAYEKLVDAFLEEIVPRYQMITGMVHKYGAKIFAQLNHNGMQCSSIYSRLPVWGPSPIADPLFREVAKEMDKVEIQELIRFYVKSAAIAQEGGFDGIEFQGSHSSILRQFLSPYTNRRNDEYGGNLINRMRLLLEAGEAVRNVVGRDMVLGIRLSGDEFIDGGLNLNDTIEIARKIEEAKIFDYINTSVGVATHYLYLVEGPMCLPPAYAVYMASCIKKAVNLPVIAVGRIKDPSQAEQVLKQGHADLVGMVRAQISDPEFANKAFNGQDDLIRCCLSCNQDCIGRVGINRQIGCVQNPAVGKEKVWGIGTLKPAKKRKHVVIVGGGPAGLEATKTAALRQHKVTIFEKENELGGQVKYASQLPYRAEFGDSIRNLLNELKQLEGITYKLGCTANENDIVGENPDVVIIATGSLPQRPMIAGCSQKNVYTVLEVLKDKISLGERIVIVDQLGFYQATGIAELLADQEKKIEILSPSLYVGQGLGRTLELELWYKRAKKKGIKLTANVSLIGVEGTKVKAVHNYSGQEYVWTNIDNVILATPHRANDELYFKLKGKIKELYRIGDCLAPRRLDSAILEGHRVARSI